MRAVDGRPLLNPVDVCRGTVVALDSTVVGGNVEWFVVADHTFVEFARGLVVTRIVLLIARRWLRNRCLEGRPSIIVHKCRIGDELGSRDDCRQACDLRLAKDRYSRMRWTRDHGDGGESGYIAAV